MQWIATFYSAPGKGKEELARILKMDPKPIGAQHFGATSDRLMREGKIDQARDTLKMFRDAGLLVGLCSHNHEVIDYAENKGWDVDFYQGSFYHSTDGLEPSKPGEVFEEAARQSSQGLIVAGGDRSRALQFGRQSGQRIARQPGGLLVGAAVTIGAAAQAAGVMVVAVGLGLDKVREGLAAHALGRVAHGEVHGQRVHAVHDQCCRCHSPACAAPGRRRTRTRWCRCPRRTGCSRPGRGSALATGRPCWPPRESSPG